MRTLLLMCSLFTLLFISCGPSADEVFIEDTLSITNYIEENNLQDLVEVTPSGIYYIIENPGNDTKPGLNDVVKCNYTGYYPDEEVFDSGNAVAFVLGGTIEGWRQGIPLIGEGGTIRLFIPSVFGYGMSGNSSIAKNQELFFDVDLLEVN